MDVQLKLRSDIAMALDDCTPYPATESEARESMERSMRWAARSHAHYYRERPRADVGNIETADPIAGVIHAADASAQRIISAGVNPGHRMRVESAPQSH